MAKVKVKEKVKEIDEKKELGGVRWFVKRMVAVFATFFVVIGVAAIGFLARDTMPKIVEEVTSEATSTERYEPAFLIVGDSSASLYKMDGSYIKKMEWPDDTGILDKPVSQLKGVDVMSGEPVWLTNGFAISTSTKYRSSDGRREVRLGEKRRDGSIPLVISYGNDDDVRILRYKSDLIKDVELIGWLDDKTYAFLGDATGTKAFYYLDLGSSVNYISPASDKAWDYKIFDKEIYYLRSDLLLDGEDKTAKVAPGSIDVVDMKGNEREIVKDEKSVIQSYVLGNDRIVYSLVDQSMFQKTGSRDVALGRCGPLLLVPDGGTVCRAGDGIEIRAEGLEPKRLFEVRDEAIFYLDKVRMAL